jgi:DNA repair protein RecO (recombination protein O)
VEYLEEIKSGYENFHLYFMLSLSRFLGFAPASGKELIQELMTAKVRSIEFQPEWIDNLMDPARFSIPLTRDQRNEVLDIMTSYYRIHIENLSEFRSIKVLNEVFNQ